jgi:hypothetical protein
MNTCTRHQAIEWFWLHFVSEFHRPHGLEEHVEEAFYLVVIGEQNRVQRERGNGERHDSAPVRRAQSRTHSSLPKVGGRAVTAN